MEISKRYITLTPGFFRVCPICVLDRVHQASKWYPGYYDTIDWIHRSCSSALFHLEWFRTCDQVIVNTQSNKNDLLEGRHSTRFFGRTFHFNCHRCVVLCHRCVSLCGSDKWTVHKTVNILHYWPTCSFAHRYTKHRCLMISSMIGRDDTDEQRLARLMIPTNEQKLILLRDNRKQRVSNTTWLIA